MITDPNHRGLFPPAVVGLRAKFIASAAVSRQIARPCSILAIHRWQSDSGCRRRRKLRGGELGVLPSNEREQETLARFARLPSYLDRRDRVAPRPHVQEDLVASDAPAYHRGVVSGRSPRQGFESAACDPGGVPLPCQEDIVHRCPTTKYVGDADHAARAGSVVVGGYRPTKPTSAKLFPHAGGVAERDVCKSAPAGGDVVSLVRRTNVARCQDVARTRIRHSWRPRDSCRRHQASEPDGEKALP